MYVIISVLKIPAIIASLSCAVFFVSLLKILLKRIIAKKSEPIADSFGFARLYSQKPVVFTFVFIIALFGVLFNSNAFRQVINYYDLNLDSKGSYCYYVDLNSDGKMYTVPAEIRIEDTSDYEDQGSYDNRSFYIDRVFLSNGGYLIFEDEQLQIGKTQSIVDTNKKEYECKLLNRHAYTPQFNEEKASKFDISLLFIEIILFLTTWAFCIYKKSNENK